MFKRYLLSGFFIFFCFVFAGSWAYSQELPKFDVDTKSKSGGDKSGKSSSTDPDMNAFIPVEKEPEIKSKAKPSYPELAKSARIEGSVWVKVLVEKDGKVKKAVVIKSDAEVFNDAAVEAAQRCTFEPAQMNGQSVACWATIPYIFKLK